MLTGMVNATEINAASREELILRRRAGRDGRRAGRGKGRRNDCADVRENIFFLNPVNILARWNGQIHSLSLSVLPSGTETYFDGGIRGKLGRYLPFEA